MTPQNILSKNILLAGVFTSLALWPGFMEPFNFPKFCVLLISSALILAKSFSQINWSNRKVELSLMNFALCAFIAFFWIRTIFNDDVYTGMFGSYGRYTGAITYTCWILIALQGSLLKTPFEVYQVISYLFAATSIIYGYAILQAFGVDPLGWEKLYEGAFSTLGNPNFLSAYAAVILTTSYWLYLYSRSNNHKIVSILFFGSSIFVLLKTSSLQGLILGCFGLLTMTIIKLYDSRNRIWIKLAISGFLLGIVGLLGVLNFGPLKNLLFQESNIYRLDFWKTGIEMARNNPFLGVGVERYGANFRQFREVSQVFRSDPNQTSDSAHNLFIHVSSTGGIFLAFLLVSIFAIALWKALLHLKARENSIGFNLYLSLFTLILVQNQLSVDNLPLSTWQWIFLAMLLSEISTKNHSKHVKRENVQSNIKMKSNSMEAKRVVFGAVLIFVSFLILARPISAQVSMKENFYLQVRIEDQVAVNEKFRRFNEIIDLEPSNIFLARLGANSLYIDQAWSQAAAIAKRGTEIDKIDYVSWWFLASSLEEMGNYRDAIVPRKQTIKLDRFNYFNYYLLCRNYKELGDKTNLNQCFSNLSRIAPNSREANEVETWISA
jgi:O-antigen ligase